MSVHYGDFNLKSDVDAYGFERDDNIDWEVYEKFVRRYISVLARRRQRWSSVVVEKTISSSSPAADGQSISEFRLKISGSKLKRFIRKGIPYHLRPKVWFLVSGAQKNMNENPDVLNNLLRAKVSKSVLTSIDNDLHRTFPNNVYFKASTNKECQKHLRLLLRACAVRRPEIGYCQGLNFVCAMIYLVLKDVQKTFWLFDSVVQKVASFYTTDMCGLVEQANLLSDLIRQFHPDLTTKFRLFNVDLTALVVKWFVCWFFETLPIETVMRIWDCLFNEGPKILLLVAFSLFETNKTEILSAGNTADIITVVKRMCTNALAVDCHTFLREVFVAELKIDDFLKHRSSQVV